MSQPVAPPPVAAQPAVGLPVQAPQDLSHDNMVRPRTEVPSGGWRRWLVAGSLGLVNPGPGAAERARAELLARVRAPLHHPHQVAVTSIKGGVGKTTVAACLGMMLAEHRGDRVVAFDASPDAGTLADRLTGQSDVSVRQLLDHLETAYSLADVVRFTSLAGRLQVLASEQDAGAGWVFHRDEYERVCEVLTRFHDIVITDSGTGLVHSAMEGTLVLADSLVVVGSPTVDGASRAGKTLDWLAAHGHGDRVSGAVVALCCDRRTDVIDTRQVRAYFEARCRAVIEIPADRHLADGGLIELSALGQRTSDALLELAAAVVEGFGGDQHGT